ncbi:MAG: pyridoxal-phosphate dependent enzyme, partial [Desulfotomaculaceae bacterium]
MSEVKNNILELIGNTPVIKLDRIRGDCAANVLAKLEMVNPSGSAKARAALG